MNDVKCFDRDDTYNQNDNFYNTTTSKATFELKSSIHVSLKSYFPFPLWVTFSSSAKA